MPSRQILRKFLTSRYLFSKHPSEVSQTSRFSSIHKLGKLVNYKPKYFSDRLAILNKHRIFQTVNICQTPRYLFLKHPYPAAGYLDTAFSIHAIQLLGWIRAATILCWGLTRLINTKRYQDSARQASLLQRLEFPYFSTDSNYLPATIKLLLCQNCRHVWVSWPWELLLLFLLLNTVCETHLYVR